MSGLKVYAKPRSSSAAGSVPRPMYYVLLGSSVVIATFGLLANSPAVVIGAMLVSPLMTPIFGISVGLSRSDIRLLRSALVAEFGGVGLVILLSFLHGGASNAGRCALRALPVAAAEVLSACLSPANGGCNDARAAAPGRPMS